MEHQLNHQQWMAFFNTTLKQLKEDLDCVDKKPLKGRDKKAAYMLHAIYDEIDDLVIKYDQSHQLNDLNALCYKLSELKPSFILNFNSITDH